MNSSLRLPIVDSALVSGYIRFLDIRRDVMPGKIWTSSSTKSQLLILLEDRSIYDNLLLKTKGAEDLTAPGPVIVPVVCILFPFRSKDSRDVSRVNTSKSASDVKSLYSRVKEAREELVMGELNLLKPFEDAVRDTVEVNLCRSIQSSFQSTKVESTSRALIVLKTSSTEPDMIAFNILLVSSSSRFPLNNNISQAQINIEGAYFSLSVFKFFNCEQMFSISFKDTNKFLLKSSSTILGHASPTVRSVAVATTCVAEASRSLV